MDMADRSPCRYQPQPHRRKTPSFSSSLLDSILRSIDESNDGELHDDNLHQLQQHQKADDHDHNHDLRFFASEPKRSSKIRFPQTQLINGEEHTPNLRRAMMIDQWIETHNDNRNRNYASRKSSRKVSSESSSSGTTTFTTSSASSEIETPSTYRSLPNSFTISRKTAEAVFLDDTQNATSTKREGKFMKLTKLRAMKIYGDLKKVRQPISPGSRFSTFLLSLFASSSSKKVKIEETMQNIRSLKKSRSIKQDHTTTCSSFSRSCMSKKQHNSGIKRSVRFYPENDTVIPDRKSISERDPNLTPLPKYERRWFREKNYMSSYKNFVVNVEDDDEDEDDLFELEIVRGVGYGQELPVFETTDLRKIRI